VSADVAPRDAEPALRHDALLYAGDEQFLAGTLPFIRSGVEAGEAVLVVVDRVKFGLLESALGGDAKYVQFADMREIGGNPARLIPVWKDFLAARTQPSKRIWGVGEPAWAGRSDAELVECRRHESLINLAFAGDAPLSLLCPYDTSSLPPEVIEGARCSHPTILDGGGRHGSGTFCELAEPFADPLPEPRAPVHELDFGTGDLADLRRFIARRARAARLGSARGDDLVLAINEVATNSVRHGGGRGTLRAWQEGDFLICEVRDGGVIDDPLVGRRRPDGAKVGGYGLWLVNHVCDLVQVRSDARGTVVRVHMRMS
jgi:anti-sigma regulatory factor (Ser/Thr protein kinase)